MTVKEFYGRIGGDYNDAVQRFQSDAVILRFLKMFLKDDNINLLSQSVENGDVKNVFRAVHTLKGIAHNLSFSEFADTCSAMTEHLRGLSALPDDTGRFYNDVNNVYLKITTAIKELEI